MLITLFLIFLLMLAALSIVWYSIRTGISPMPSSRRARKVMLENAEPVPGGAIIDLGSGWGGLVIAFAKRYPDRQVIGYELSILPWLFSLLMKYLLGLNNLTLYRRDFLDADLSQAGLLICYLYTGGMSELKEKLDREVQGVVPIVSNSFALPGAKAEKSFSVGMIFKSTIYFYRFVNLTAYE